MRRTGEIAPAAHLIAGWATTLGTFGLMVALAIVWSSSCARRASPRQFDFGYSATGSTPA